jgi:hypothetical protein
MMELRPGVVNQLTVLSRLFDAYWLTHWEENAVNSLWALLYASLSLQDIGYCHWQKYDAKDKVFAVLDIDPDFYWLEDPFSTGDLKKLHKAGLSDRYIEVEPKGMWGFTRACNELLVRAGTTEEQLKKAGGKWSLFEEPLGLHFDYTIYK